MFFDRPEAGERAVLVHLHLGSGPVDDEDPREFETLVISAGGDPVDFIIARRSKPDPKFFAGQGKLEEIKASVVAHDADLVIFNHDLTPGQERNIEKVLECRVLSRIGLILDIFGQRARTHEGKLQVELAQIQHSMSRLVRGWTHLERQRGGIGARGGPGETQIELDRRLLRERERGLLRRLEKVRSQRAQGRRSRQRAELPAVSLVGYTNAGKSTLFNQLTTAEVYAADQLFATLDPTLRRLIVPGVGPIVIADTVGFIRNLPHKLVDAFRATLEETIEADLLLHVIDAASDERQDQQAQVEHVLDDIGAGQVPRLDVFNKIDLAQDPEPRIERDANGVPVRVRVSALTGAGMDLLREAIAERLSGVSVSGEAVLGVTGGGLRARLYADEAVLAESVDEEGRWHLTLRLPRSEWDRLVVRPEVFSVQISGDLTVPTGSIC
jgi:GTP-binding protein HflX